VADLSGKGIGGVAVPAVTRSEFSATGFTAAHLAGARLVGWSVPSTLVVEVRRLLGESWLQAQAREHSVQAC